MIELNKGINRLEYEVMRLAQHEIVTAARKLPGVADYWNVLRSIYSVYTNGERFNGPLSSAKYNMLEKHLHDDKGVPLEVIHALRLAFLDCNSYLKALRILHDELEGKI